MAAKTSTVCGPLGTLNIHTCPLRVLKFHACQVCSGVCYNCPEVLLHKILNYSFIFAFKSSIITEHQLIASRPPQPPTPIDWVVYRGGRRWGGGRSSQFSILTQQMLIKYFLPIILRHIFNSVLCIHGMRIGVFRMPNPYRYDILSIF